MFRITVLKTVAPYTLR